MECHIGSNLSQRQVIWRDSVGVGVHFYGLQQSERVFSLQSFFVLFVIEASWRATKMAKQLLKATPRSVLGSIEVV